MRVFVFVLVVIFELEFLVVLFSSYFYDSLLVLVIDCFEKEEDVKEKIKMLIESLLVERVVLFLVMCEEIDKVFLVWLYVLFE